jgi:flagellar basal body-associated protein FliL
MKKLLIILVVLLLLGGGGFAAWWFYLRADPNAPPPLPPPPEISQLTIPERAEDALVVNIIKNGKIEKHFFFRFTLLFDAADKREKASKLMPALINDFNAELHGLLARKLVEEIKDNNERIELLQRQLQKLCDRRLGPGIVYQVTITNMEEAE